MLPTDSHVSAAGADHTSGGRSGAELQLHCCLALDAACFCWLRRFRHLHTVLHKLRLYVRRHTAPLTLLCGLL